jgi:molecular chaperone Hsp33
MSNLETGGSADRNLRFLFEDADIRGELAQLDGSLRDILAQHQYPPTVGRLLGEFLAAAVLLSSTLKFDGKLILQARSAGQVPLLMAECSSDLHVRGIVRGAQQATAMGFDQLLANGQLAITVDPAGGQRYQGIVPLVEGSLAASLEAYFDQSEQLHTRIWLACDGERAAGMLLQQLPASVTRDQDERDAQWQHACTLGATLSAAELLALPAETLIHRLYHQENLRLFQPAEIRFRCSCSRERTLGALATLQPADIDDILAEQGSVTMDCEFCNQRFVYQRADLQHLLDGDPGRILH